MKTTLLVGILLALPLASALPVLPAPIPAQGIQAPAGETSQLACSAAGDFCAHSLFTGTLKGCTQGASDYACTVAYTISLYLDGTRPGCGEVITQVIPYDLGCTEFVAAPYKNVQGPVEVTYHNVAPDGAVSEPGKVCVDVGTPAVTCSSFVLTVRLPGQGTVAANSTTPASTEIGHATVTICQDPTSLTLACANVQIDGHNAGCTDSGAGTSCMVRYDVVQTEAGIGTCSTLQIGALHNTGCASPGFVGVAQEATSITAPTNGSATLHAQGVFCLDGPAGRCVSFGLDVPVA